MERQILHRFALRGRVLPLATDGSPSAAAATQLAESIAERCQMRVHAVAVLDTRPASIPPPLDLPLQVAGADHRARRTRGAGATRWVTESAT